VVVLPNNPLSESSVKSVSLSFLGFPDSSENSFAVSVEYFEKSYSQFLRYSLFEEDLISKSPFHKTHTV
jgi:hypothetical protein